MCVYVCVFLYVCWHNTRVCMCVYMYMCVVICVCACVPINVRMYRYNITHYLSRLFVTINIMASMCGIYNN